jgi:replicative DNA helicase
MIDLKELAEKFQIPVLLSSRIAKNEIQLSRLSDLRVSGIPEQLLDIVLFIENPLCFDVMSSELPYTIKGETNIRVAKNKFGSQGAVKFNAQLPIQQFKEFNESSFWIKGGEKGSVNEE